MKYLRPLLLACLLSFRADKVQANPLPPVPLPTTLRDAERELAELDRRINDLDGRAAVLREQVSLRERRTLVRSRVYARLARAGLLPIVGGFDALVAHAMKLEGVRRAILLDLEELKRLQRGLVDLGTHREVVVARRAVVVAQRDALSQAQALVEEAEERRRAFERAFLSPRGSTDHASVYGATLSVRPAAPEATFEAARGRLPLPLTGRVEIRSRRGVSGPALELLTSPGAAVRVVHPGRIAFSGAYEDYGRLVLVDHGAGYFTLYGNLDQIDVRVGDAVAGGAQIGLGGG
ncbi:MAG: peptidoglycan DD-metalloendopeptidase family protein, partial [Myxococcales bacterium]|nr:peptidoglycan DD-metalloendopeptidase family protein [Myxococcales bacterium]